MPIWLDLLLRFLGLVIFGWLSLSVAPWVAGGEGQTAEIRFFLWLFSLSLLGFLGFPYLVRWGAREARRQVESRPLEELGVYFLGFLLGGAFGAFLSFPLGRLPGIWGVLAPLTGFILSVLGVEALFWLRRDELIALWPFLHTRSQEETEGEGKGKGKALPGLLVDSSVLIDGRIERVAPTGFLPAPLIVPRFVLGELQQVADASDPQRRARGRLGLEVLNRLQNDERVAIRVVDWEAPGRGVDQKLVALARKTGCALLTTDFNLQRVAEIQKVRVLNLNQLAEAVRITVLAGEELRLRIHQPGKEPGQGVGFLEDGTMVVVEGGSRWIGQEVDVVVTRVLQTRTGRIIFAVPRAG